jgi:hypothetical protein
MPCHVGQAEDKVAIAFASLLGTTPMSFPGLYQIIRFATLAQNVSQVDRLA